MDTNGDARSNLVASPAAADDVDATVKPLLDVLTKARFDPVSDRIVGWMNTECVKDVRKFAQAIRVILERAKDDAARSDLYARLCRKMMEQISPNVHDDGIKNADGKPIAGGQLFRKYLLNGCQEDFERGWVATEATAAAAATKASKERNKGQEQVLHTEEYHVAQKAKRQGLGLVKFIGELFKLEMLTDRIMHECVKKLLGNVENPEEEEIESLCQLLTTVGQILDTPKARAHMDVYFSRMKELTKSPNVNSRLQFVLQDVIELRERKWIPKGQVALAAKEEPVREKGAFTRRLSISREGFRHGGERGDHTQAIPDGWAAAGGPATRPSSKAGDLSKFGKIDKSAPMAFGPSSVFQKGDKSKSRESTIRQGSSNRFSRLSGNPEMAAEVAGKSSCPPSHKSFIVPDGATPLQRRKLQLPLRTVLLENKSESMPVASTVGSQDEGEEEPFGTPSVSEANSKARIEEDSKEFFSIRDLQEAEVYFTKLPSEHRRLLVDKLVTKAVESKQADVQLVADLFYRVISRNLCSPASFEEGFTPTAEIIDDIVIDGPKAMELFAIMLTGAHLHLDGERRKRLVSRSVDGENLIQAVVGDVAAHPAAEAADQSDPGSVVKLEWESMTSSSSSEPASQKSGERPTLRQGSPAMFSMSGADPKINGEDTFGKFLSGSTPVGLGAWDDASGIAKDLSSVVSEPESAARPIPSPGVNSPRSLAPRRMSREAVSECIKRSARLLSGLHDVGTALAVFHTLPPGYHGRLVDALVSWAMEPGTDSMRAQVLAYFFHCAAKRQLCSVTSFEEGISMTTSALEDIVADVPDALERYAVIVKAIRLHEDLSWRARVFEKAGAHSPELADLFSTV